MPSSAKKIVEQYWDVVEPRLTLGAGGSTKTEWGEGLKKNGVSGEAKDIPGWAFAIIFAVFLSGALYLSVQVSSFLIYGKFN